MAHYAIGVVPSLHRYNLPFRCCRTTPRASQNFPPRLRRGKPRRQAVAGVVPSLHRYNLAFRVLPEPTHSAS
jgi:hypothetical protein